MVTPRAITNDSKIYSKGNDKGIKILHRKKKHVFNTKERNTEEIEDQDSMT